VARDNGQEYSWHSEVKQWSILVPVHLDCPIGILLGLINRGFCIVSG